MMFYKYRKFDEFTKDLISNGELYCSELRNLNDPLEGAFSWAAVLKAVEQKGDNRLSDKLKEVSSRIYQDKVTGKCQEFFQAVKNRIDGSGILSFSLTGKEPLMWSHYADGHKGFCVGYDRKLIEEYIDSQEPPLLMGGNPPVIFDHLITYSPVPDYIDRICIYLENELNGKPIDLDHLFVDLVVVSILATKSEHWKYEKEARIIRSKPGPIKIPLNIVKKVIVGQKIDPENLAFLKSLLDNPALAHIEMKQARFVENSFSINFTSAR